MQVKAAIAASNRLPTRRRPHARSSSRTRTISAGEQLLPNRRLRIRVIDTSRRRAPSGRHPAQTQPQLIDRLGQPASRNLVVASELVVPAAILQLDATAALAGLADDADPGARDLFVRVLFGQIVRGRGPARQCVDDVHDFVQVVEARAGLGFDGGEELGGEIA
jgi:hypothetical protein